MTSDSSLKEYIFTNRCKPPPRGPDTPTYVSVLKSQEPNVRHSKKVLAGSPIHPHHRSPNVPPHGHRARVDKGQSGHQTLYVARSAAKFATPSHGGGRTPQQQKRGQVILVASKFEALILLSRGKISEIYTDRPGLCIQPIYTRRHGRTRSPGVKQAGTPEDNRQRNQRQQLPLEKCGDPSPLGIEYTFSRERSTREHYRTSERPMPALSAWRTRHPQPPHTIMPPGRRQPLPSPPNY